MVPHAPQPTFADRVQSRSIQLCARRVSDAGDPIKPCCGRTSSQFAETCHLPHASPQPGAHCSGTTAVVSLTRSSVPREVDDCSIQVTSFSTALSLSSLDRLRASRLLLPRSGLERSDLVRWPVATYCGAARVWSLTAYSGSRGAAAPYPSPMPY